MATICKFCDEFISLVNSPNPLSDDERALVEQGYCSTDCRESQAFMDEVDAQTIAAKELAKLKIAGTPSDEGQMSERDEIAFGNLEAELGPTVFDDSTVELPEYCDGCGMEFCVPGCRHERAL